MLVLYGRRFLTHGGILHISTVDFGYLVNCRLICDDAVFNKCLELAESMCEKAKNNSPILHSMAMDSLIGSLCKLHHFKQVEEYYRMAVKNNLRIEETTFDKIIKLQLTNDIWKTIYEDEKEKARENGITLSPEE